MSADSAKTQIHRMSDDKGGHKDHTVQSEWNIYIMTHLFVQPMSVDIKTFEPCRLELAADPHTTFCCFCAFKPVVSAR